MVNRTKNNNNKNNKSKKCSKKNKHAIKVIKGTIHICTSRTNKRIPSFLKKYHWKSCKKIKRNHPKSNANNVCELKINVECLDNYINNPNNILSRKQIINKLLQLFKSKKSNTNLELQDALNEGHFGTVYRTNNKDIIVKINKSVDIPNGLLELCKEHYYDNMIYKEALIMSILGDNNHIAKCLGLDIFKLPSENSYAPGLIMQYYEGGSILDKLKKGNIPFEYNTKIQWLLGICKGMKFVHSKKITHRDLACRNILLDTNNEAIITDFGISRPELVTINSNSDHRIAFPWPGRSYELLLNKTTVYTNASDVWSFGILISEMFNNGEQPFKNFSNIEYINLLKRIRGIQKGSGNNTRFYSAVSPLLESESESESENEIVPVQFTNSLAYLPINPIRPNPNRPNPSQLYRIPDNNTQNNILPIEVGIDYIRKVCPAPKEKKIQQIFNSCIQINPSARPSFSELYEDIKKIKSTKYNKNNKNNNRNELEWNNSDPYNNNRNELEWNNSDLV